MLINCDYTQILGIESLAVDIKESKMTVVGDVDPVAVIRKLKKHWSPQIHSVGPAKEEKKTEKDEKSQVQVVEYQVWPDYRSYSYPYYYGRTMEENPNSCVIC